MARNCSDAFSDALSWQFSRFMHPRRGPGREKRPSLAIYRRHASKMSWLWQYSRAMYPKSPANRLSGMHSAHILPGRGPFRCTDPSNHARRANLAIPRCFVWVLRVGWGRSGARGGCRLAPAACAPPPRFVRGVAIGPTYPRGLPRHPAPVRGVAVISGCSFELSPPTRTMFLLPLLPSRETCPLPPSPSEARTFRGALCEVSAFASRRWVCPSPSTRRLCLVRPFRGVARC